MVVSVNQKIVIGSHGDESTPLGAPTGVGYRRLLTDWNQWTAGRTLKAIYRLSESYSSFLMLRNDEWPRPESCRPGRGSCRQSDVCRRFLWSQHLVSPDQYTGFSLHLLLSVRETARRLHIGCLRGINGEKSTLMPPANDSEEPCASRA